MSHKTCDECDCALFDVDPAGRGGFMLLGAETDFALQCAALCERFGFSRVAAPADALFAIAPLLTTKIAKAVWAAPRLGTLIFHPSALPYRRGPDAIRHTVAAGERVSAATWFWCNEGLDTGPICAQEVVVLRPRESPGRAYHTRFCPAALRALERALSQIATGEPSRIEQDHTLSTYDPRIPDPTPPPGAAVQAAVFGGAEAPPGLKALADSIR